MPDIQCFPTCDDADDTPTSSNSISRSEPVDSAVSRNGKHRMVACPVCDKTMRSDNIKRHQRVHDGVKVEDMEGPCVRSAQEKESARDSDSEQDGSFVNDEIIQTSSLNQTFSCSVCGRGFPDYTLGEHERRCTEGALIAKNLTSPWFKNFKRKVLKCGEEYQIKVLMGRVVSDVLDGGEIPERALPQEYIDARDLWLAERDRPAGTCFRMFS